MADADCFPRVCRQIYRVVAETLRFMGASSDDIDDVAQRVAVRVWRTWDEPHIIKARNRPNSSWEGYLRRAARNEYISLRRSEKRRWNRQVGYVDLPHPSAIRPGTVRQVPNDPNELEQRLAWQRLRREINQLSTPRRRAIVRLSLIAEMTPNEIAERLEISSRTVRQHLAEGLNELRQRLSQPPDDD